MGTVVPVVGSIVNWASFEYVRPSLKMYKGWSTDWFFIVEQYSRCDLTFETDKFPAIAGLAKLIQQKTGASYFCGIWQDQLAGGLLWRNGSVARPPHKPLCRPQHSRAPSWSWAALDGWVGHYHISEDERKAQLFEFVGVTQIAAHARPSNPQWIEDAAATLAIRTKITRVFLGHETDQFNGMCSPSSIKVSIH
jgi:hypothetical protein